MKNAIRILGVTIITFGTFIYIIPFINQLENVFISSRYFDVRLLFGLFNSILYIICGIGIFRLKEKARKIWLIYSVCIIFVNLPFTVASIQQLIKGSYKTLYIPSFYWIKTYGSLLLLIYSIIFLVLPKVKLPFKAK
jgi:magnesium-transporting ATPase (P-type)